MRNKLIACLLEKGLSVKLRTDGCSMLPVIKPGEEIIICRLTDIPQTKTICLYRLDNKLILHRLIKKNTKRDRYIFKGDHNLRPDAPAAFDQILGYIPLSDPHYEISSGVLRKKLRCLLLPGQRIIL